MQESFFANVTPLTKAKVETSAKYGYKFLIDLNNTKKTITNLDIGYWDFF